ncbi:MAG: dTDP-4-dehydrorhamnose 3,5-epimerase [Bacteroidales bacterium]|nr:dTDP-4-dehydrorhamnose 3,5-epimerase [Bacteroidales bacterium]
MNFISTEFEGLYIIEPKIFKDTRGYFYESYNRSAFEQNGLFFDFVQDNQSRSQYGVVRGLHYQIGLFAQAKLVRVLEGKVLDVVVDLRTDSKSFGKYYSVELSAENQLQFLVPRGFAHGFSVLSENATFLYKCDNFYNKESERGIMYNDPALNIDWKIPLDKMILSPKDMENKYFEEIDKF